MSEAESIEPFTVPEYFVDGFDDYEVKNGILTCAGYRVHKPTSPSNSPLKVVILRIVMPVANLAQVIQNATTAAGKLSAHAGDGHAGDGHSFGDGH